MISPGSALSAIPAGLRDPLIREYESVVRNFLERKWSPSELSGGLLCEIVYTILDGHAKGSYATAPAKPPNMVSACRALESNGSVPRSFQILIPRLLPALYEVRNNRGVGHVGEDVDPNHMDALAVVSLSNWIMAELVRVFHVVSTDDAQSLVDRLVERRVPLVWQERDVKRVLKGDMALGDQVLLLLASSTGTVAVDDLVRWTEAAKGYLLRLLRQMHRRREVELSSDELTLQLLPPGSKKAEAVARAAAEQGLF